MYLHDFGGQVPDDWKWIDGHPFPPQIEVAGEISVPMNECSDVMVCHECNRAWLVRKMGWTKGLKRINIGCDIFKVPGMINVDLRWSVKPTVVMNILRMGFKDSCSSEINLGNIVEHLSEGDIRPALNECKRILVPTGVVYIVSPMLDIVEECYKRGETDQNMVNQVKNGDAEGPNSHQVQLKSGDLEKFASDCGFRKLERLNLKRFPYMVVSNINDPKPDPWQYGIAAFK